MIRHHHGMYLTDHGNPHFAQLKGWTWSFDCLKHDNMHWRFDGKYLRNELGTYLARKAIDINKTPNHYAYLHMPKAGQLHDVDYNDDRLYWEYDPVANLLGYPTSHTHKAPLYLSRNCYTGRDENKNIDTSKRDCNWFQYAKPKLTDNPTTTKSDEEVEQKFSLDYQGNFLLNEMLISTYDVQCRSSSTLEAVATKAGPASGKQLGRRRT